jgi:hypothetical protein
MKRIDPLGNEPIEVAEGSQADEHGNTREYYAAVRRSRIKHALGLLHQNGVKPVVVIAVEEVMELDSRLDGQKAAAVLDLYTSELQPDYRELLAPCIERVLAARARWRKVGGR